MRLFFIISLCFICFLSKAEQVISSISSNDHEFVIKLNNKPEYIIFTLNSPNRLVIDLKKCKIKPSANKYISNNNLVKSIRTAARDQDNLRIVFDLNIALDNKKYLILEDNNKQGYQLTVRLNKSVIVPPPRAKELTAKKAEIVPPKKTNKDIIIVIDPGHGGTDPGAIGSKGSLEKSITLSYSLELKKYIENKFGYQVVLTRYGDYFISLDDRIAKAKNAKGAIFLSIHADSYIDQKARGMSIYTISDKASEEEDKKTLTKKNYISDINLAKQDKEVAQMLVDLARRKSKNNSIALSKSILKEIGNSKVVMQKEPLKFSGFKVLKDAEIAGVMIELGYISNSDEEFFLQQPQNKQKIVASIGNAIGSYFRNKN